ncbi:2-hydroxyacid dehydrogenase [Galbitalea sp. SE-J8]|uniref:2-hydroxyacid dehydrogenase n=1 Tax=Galbitalea sp. SE-J8 TaxID=3054952 RepID=UPI00259C7086|nr:2-hydroxyacid dehydrogenase [Galbitalea sp. SE-J8]MDM4763289.1 2-hydroxyacid dehydrogenase [Galbitalea sp. SE-J8]
MLTVTLPTPDLIADFGPVPEGVRLVEWDVQSPPPEPETIDVVLIPHFVVRRDVFRRLQDLPRLSLVQLPSAGFDHAVPHIPARVAVANGRGVHDDETAELALGLTLASLRGIDTAVRDAAVEHWPAATLRPSLADRRVLLVGYGSIGTEIAARLAAFKTHLTIVARTARDEHGVRVHGFDELPGLARDAEVVILIVPLTDETRGLVDAAFLAALPDGALVVNVARGGVIDTDALVAELATGRIAAALDVTRPEPLPAGHPLWRTPNTIITPHLGGNTTLTPTRTLELMRRQVAHLVAGEPVENVVRPASA